MALEEDDWENDDGFDENAGDDDFDDNFDDNEFAAGDDDNDDWDNGDSGEWGATPGAGFETPDAFPQVSDYEEPKEIYKTIDKGILIEKMNVIVNELAEEIYCEPVEARLLLQHTDWSMRAAQRMFLQQEENPGEYEAFRIQAGLDVNPDATNTSEGSEEVECPICLDDVPAPEVAGLDCGHRACLECWESYVVEEAKKYECFKLTCVDETCKLACIPERLRSMGLNEKTCELLESKQMRFRLKKFVETQNDFQECLSAECDLYQHILTEDTDSLGDIYCECGYAYCIKCKNKGHRPARCELVTDWVRKEGAESENLKWIKANTKKCPKCKTPIQKNQGCNHMTCRTAGGCGYEFCWLCKGDWAEHGSSTGGYYKCNIFEDRQKKGVQTEEEEARADAKSKLERYQFYFERYDNHIKCIGHMQRTLEQADGKMSELMSRFGWKPNEVGFIKEAAKTIIDCRKLLAWSYPIGYYLDPECPQFMLFTKQHQADLEKYTEKLQELAEQELEEFQDNSKREEVVNYQRIIANYHKHLLEYIEVDINVNCKFLLESLDDEEN